MTQQAQGTARWSTSVYRSYVPTFRKTEEAQWRDLLRHLERPLFGIKNPAMESIFSSSGIWKVHKDVRCCVLVGSGNFVSKFRYKQNTVLKVSDFSIWPQWSKVLKLDGFLCQLGIRVVLSKKPYYIEAQSISEWAGFNRIYSFEICEISDKQYTRNWDN